MSNDTLNCLKIKEPVAIPGLGSIFWAPTYAHGPTGMDRNWKDFEEFSDYLDTHPSTLHFGIPGGYYSSVIIHLTEPLSDTVHCAARIYPTAVDIIKNKKEAAFMSEFFNLDPPGEYSVRGEDVPPDKSPIQDICSVVKQILTRYRGESAFVHYNPDPEENGHPLQVWIEFDGCHDLPWADQLLPILAFWFQYAGR
jgi:hypothetical protein